jgi:hypothetical protein
MTYVPLVSPKRKTIPISIRNMFRMFFYMESYVQAVIEIDNLYADEFTDWMVNESRNYRTYLETLVSNGIPISHGRLDYKYNTRAIYPGFYVTLTPKDFSTPILL